MSIIQLRFDFGQPIAQPKSKSKHTVSCEKCDLPIDLLSQSVREIKACPHCGDRTWLLNLKTEQASILYSITHDLGGRLRK
jgi:uncharacterized paraquat-inducible protein A